MSRRKKNKRPTYNYSEQINRLKQAVDAAEFIVVGAGAGLSEAAGLSYFGKRFRKNFAEFIDKYHFTDMYSATFYPYDTPEEYWAYMSRHILLNRFSPPAGEPYLKLLELIKDKDYFVITTNMDHQFQKAGFQKKRLFYTQGDYGLWQCSAPCHDLTYDNKHAVMEMVHRQKDLRIPTELVPRCPKCGSLMSMNLRNDSTFVQDAGWYNACDRYEYFTFKLANFPVLFLELGVGNNTPAIIKHPFWRMTAENPRATYACINLSKADCPDRIRPRAICIQADINRIL